MFGLSFWEIAVIAAVALLALGPKRLPEVAKSLGKFLRELRNASSGLRSAVDEPLEEIRKPLLDMRNDLVSTVHQIGREIEKEVKQDENTPNPEAKNNEQQNDPQINNASTTPYDNKGSN